jgi:hypothetical protein
MSGGPRILGLRRRIASGERLGPSLYAAGPIVDGDPPAWPSSAVVTTVERAAGTVAEQAEAGYDFLKVYTGLSDAVYRRITKEAAARGIPVVGHVPAAVGLDAVLAARQTSIEHLDGYWYEVLAPEVGREVPEGQWRKCVDVARLVDEGKLSSGQLVDRARLAELARATRKAGTWIVPTLVVTQRFLLPPAEKSRALRDDPVMRYVDPRYRDFWKGHVDYLESLGAGSVRSLGIWHEQGKAIVGALHAAGVPLLAGTDTSNPFVVPGFSVHEELRFLVDAGLTPREALLAATREAARFLGVLDESGTIEVGKRADLVLVDSDPLASVASLARPAGVMVRGAWLDRARLDALLEEIAEGHEATRRNAGDPVPLPDDVAIVAPGEEVDRRVRALSGRWHGRWGGSLGSRLVVERIEGDAATVVYAWGDHAGGLFTRGWARREARVLPHGAIRFGEGAVFTFEIDETLDVLRGTRTAGDSVDEVEMRRGDPPEEAPE